MRRSSRIAYFLGFSVLLASAANAGGVRGSIAGIARHLAPIRPVVGGSRNLSPMAALARRGTHSRELGPQNIGSVYGPVGYGYGLANGGLPAETAGIAPSDGPDNPGSNVGPYRVIPAPPRPCVAPLIIKVSNSTNRDRPIGGPTPVRVVYGAPRCGRS